MNNLNKSSSYKGHLGYYYFYLSLKRWPSSLKYSLNLYQKRINMVRDTSLTAYQQTYSRGTAQHLRYKIYDFIVQNPTITRQQISDRMGIAIQSVCPRCLELIEANLITENGKNNGKYMLEAVNYGR